MSPAFLLAVFSAVILHGQDSRPIVPPPAVAVFLSFDHQPSEISIEAMKREAGSVLGTAGLTLDWRLLENNHGDAPSHELAVLRFTGTCGGSRIAPLDVARLSSDKVVLGWTKLSKGRVLPFGEVECDQIRRYIEPVAAGNSPQRERILGRVLGRVVAHELFHVLTRTSRHSNTGAAKNAHTAREMAFRKFAFSAHDRELLRQAEGAGAP